MTGAVLNVENCRSLWRDIFDDTQWFRERYGPMTISSATNDSTKDTDSTAGDGYLTDAELDSPCELTIVRWKGRLRCAYLNNHRIAGGKPWGGGPPAKEWSLTLREVIRAFPALQKALGVDYLGSRISPTKKEPSNG